MFQIVGDDLYYNGEKVGLLLRSVRATLLAQVEDFLERAEALPEYDDLDEEYGSPFNVYRVGYRDGIRACRRLGIDEDAVERITDDTISLALREASQD